jgi:hypothetical protein
MTEDQEERLVKAVEDHYRVLFAISTTLIELKNMIKDGLEEADNDKN